MNNLIMKRDNERYISNYIKEKIELNAIDTTKISDGANTFGELYDTIEKLIDDLDYWVEVANSNDWE